MKPIHQRQRKGLVEREVAGAETPEVDEDGTFALAIFPVDQYLNDAAIRQAVNDIARGGTADIKPVDAKGLLPFHPISMDAIRQKKDMDVYILLSCYGTLVRTRTVIKNGVALTNPPPEDYLCDSCHTAGWLKQEFQTSKLDSANVSTWICPACLKLKPEERDVRF